MKITISWLHLTDLHCGLDKHGWLWPKSRSDFYADLRALLPQLGGLDLVFFTGDLTQQGRKVEFDELNKELERWIFWECLAGNWITRSVCVSYMNEAIRRLWTCGFEPGAYGRVVDGA